MVFNAGLTISCARRFESLPIHPGKRSIPNLSAIYALPLSPWHYAIGPTTSEHKGHIIVAVRSIRPLNLTIWSAGGRAHANCRLVRLRWVSVKITAFKWRAASTAIAVSLSSSSEAKLQEVLVKWPLKSNLIKHSTTFVYTIHMSKRETPSILINLTNHYFIGFM